MPCLGWLGRSVELKLLRGDTFPVRVDYVVDGDGLQVTRLELGAGQQLMVRLHGIDAPEWDQPLGGVATRYLRRLAEGQRFILEVVNIRDRYGRVVAAVYRSERDRSLNHLMVTAGMAYRWTKYGELEGLAEAEAIARAARRGVWGLAGGGMRPWVYRKQQRLGARSQWHHKSGRRYQGAPYLSQRRRRRSRDNGCLSAIALIGILGAITFWLAGGLAWLLGLIVSGIGSLFGG